MDRTQQFLRDLVEAHGAERIEVPLQGERLEADACAFERDGADLRHRWS